MGLSDIDTIPDTGAVFTIGRSRFADNVASHFFIRKDPVVSITCGDEHSAVICQSGRLFVFGSNDWGQLGLGHKNHVSKPSCVKILKPEKVTHVACGRAHTLICTGGQKIFACGCDQEGQLGRGTSAVGDSASSPVLVYDCGLAGPRILQIAAGSHHSLALTSDGGVVAWGSNLEGQLGLSGISGLVNKPTKVHIPEAVKEISTGYYHSAFLTESGLIYVCGESESGKLGIDVSFSTQVAPKQMQLPSPAVRVVCGGHHTLILAENGNLYCVGSNASGQLGMGTNVTEVQTPKLLPRGALQNETISKIACGESHSAVVTESGKLFTCGDGRHGKLGLEENENNVHELTLAPKYQELFISNVACGGCHTILVGRRRDTNNQTHREADSTQTDLIQKKNPLPPLKLPVNRLQSEQHAENTHEETNVEAVQEKNDADTATIIKTPTKSAQNNTMESTEQNSTADSTNNVENGIDKAESPRKTSEDTVTEVSPATEKIAKPITVDADEKPKNDDENTESAADTENNIKEEGKTESAIMEETNTTSNVQNNSQDNKEHVNSSHVEETDETKSETAKNETESSNNVEKEATTPKKQTPSSGSTPPPKPPRLKPDSGSNSPTGRKSLSAHQNETPKVTMNNITANEEHNVNNAKDAELPNNLNDLTTEAVQSPAKSSMKGRKSGSVKSRVDTQETIEIEEQDKVDGVDTKKNNVEKQKTENDNAPDDADVVQSPAPKTSKMSKLFKSKKQQEMENGTKTTGAANHKSKSKTCVIL